MSWGAAFLFDEETETGLRACWQAIAGAGISDFMLGLDYPPHLTLWMAESMQMDGLRETLQALAARTAPLALTFPSLGIFSGDAGVVYLAPTVNSALLRLHENFWQAALPCLQDPAAHYAPGVWAPHVTLGYGLTRSQVNTVVEMLLHAPRPRSGRIEEVIFGSFAPLGGSRLETLRFGGASEGPGE